jgi:chitin disaccharide deacetylase
MDGGKRSLIVNADDFGRSPEINAGVIKAHEEGILTSASLMVRWPAAAEASAYGGDREGFSLGLHVDLCEWAFADGEWFPVYEVVPPDDPSAVAAEVKGQLEIFRDLVGRDPTHVDSHQHIHVSDPIATPVIKELAQELGVPLRSASADVQYRGDFYGQTPTGDPLPEAISVDRLIEIISSLSPGVTELGCHPGKGEQIGTTYNVERQRELTALCDQLVREVIKREGIALCTFADITGK